MKQKGAEENIMENRLRKLMQEEARLKKETNKAHNNIHFANSVAQRR